MSNIFLLLSYLLHSKNNFELYFRFFHFPATSPLFSCAKHQFLCKHQSILLHLPASSRSSCCFCCCFPCMTSIFSISSGLSSPSTIHIYVTLILQISKTTPVIIIIPIIRLINHLFLSLLSYNGLINLDTFSDGL